VYRGFGRKKICGSEIVEWTPHFMVTSNMEIVFITIFSISPTKEKKNGLSFSTKRIMGPSHPTVTDETIPSPNTSPNQTRVTIITMLGVPRL
jgi:hypothetical protein